MNEQAPNPAWTGRGRLQNLVAELQRQKESKLDFVADARNLMVVAGEKQLILAPADAVAEEWLPKTGMPIKASTMPQLGKRTNPEIPAKFLRELTDTNASIASTLANDLLQMNPQRHFVRCLDGQVRGLLSNSYRVLDNYDLAFNALAVAKDNDAEVIEASLSDTHMRIKFTTKAVWDAVAEEQDKHGPGSHKWLGEIGRDGGWELPGGPGTVHPLITISNSETGHGGLNIQVGIVKAFCVNMAVMEKVQAHIHLGGKLEIGVYSEETLAAESKTIMLKCRDAIKAAFDKERFAKLIAKANGAAEMKIERPRDAVENVVSAGLLTADDNDAILEYFLVDYNRTKYGLAQAVARYSQDVDSDKAADLEELAGKVLMGAV